MIKLKEIINEDVPKSGNVFYQYSRIIKLVQDISRKLNDDEVYELHEKLKKFFNKTI